MDEKRKAKLRAKLEELIWKQVGLFEKINLGLETDGALLKDDERMDLAEVEVGIGQLELEIEEFMAVREDATKRCVGRQNMFPEIEAIPLDPNEIPF